MRSNLTPNEPDSPSALVRGAKNAVLGYGRMVVSWKSRRAGYLFVRLLPCELRGENIFTAPNGSLKLVVILP